MLSCYFARRPFDAAQLRCPWGRGVMPPVSADARSDLSSRFLRVRERARQHLVDTSSPNERLTLELLTEVCGFEIADLRAASSRYVVSPLPEASLTAQILVWMPSATISTVEDADMYLACCRAVPRALDENAAELAAGRMDGQTPVRRLLERAAEQISSYLASPLATDPILAALPQGLNESFGSHLEDIVVKTIRPAFERYLAELKDQSWPTARDDDHAGIRWVPGGDEAYEDAIVTNTTLPLTGEHLHELGLELVSRLRQEAAGIASVLGWYTGFADVRDRLRTDPGLYYRDAATMLSDADSAMRRASIVVPQWVTDQLLPPCVLTPMSPLESPNGVLGRYETAPLSRESPARYWLNVMSPRSRATYETEVLTFHESIPGHHVQMATSQELMNESSFRRLVHVLVYSEGWALYMEQFADEVGLYTSDISRLGMISFMLWRACRLVVDTGLHRFGWTRNQAIAYLHENTILTAKNIENEVDRYIAFPASSLGYMVGRIAIESLRNQAVSNTSSPEENRRFFTRLLGSGPMTMRCLEKVMGCKIEV